MRLTCGHCGNPLEALATEQSTLIVCPKCSQVVEVPHDGSVHSLALAETLPLTPPVPGAGSTPSALPPNESASAAQSGDAARSDTPSLQLFGNYELLEEIARGGMGVVFKARQVRLDRVVALKMILGGRFASPQDVERFYTEATAAAQLQHPGIVPVFEFGEHDGCHYYSMGFVEGFSLAERLESGPLPPQQAAAMAIEIAVAVEYAHAHGVIHRDLKPGNILLDVDGSPRITDFGLAKRVETEGSHTIAGQVLGTPSFMAPEQAAGDLERIGPASDVYALGAMLYAMLTGHPPFRAASLAETLRQVQETEPVSPRQLNPAVDRDLETICLTCLQKEPARRYASAQTLADDLERFRRGEPIHARPVGLVERAVRWCRREPALAGLMGVIGGLLVTLAVGGYVFALRESGLRAGEKTQRIAAQAATARAQQETQRAEQEAREKARALEEVAAEKAKAEQLAKEKADEAAQKELARKAAVAAQEDSQRLAARAIYDQALAHLTAGERRRGLLWLVRALEQTPEREEELQRSIRLALGAWRDSFRRPRMVFEARGYGRSLGAVGRGAAISPDGRRIVIESSRNSEWTIRDTATGGAIGLPLDLGRDLPAGPRLAFYSPDGTRIATAGPGNQVRLFDAETGKLLHVLDHPDLVSLVAFAPVGGRVATAAGKQAFLWNTETGEQICPPLAETTEIVAITWSPDGKHLAAGGPVKLWNGETGAAERELSSATVNRSAFAFLDLGRVLVTLGSSGKGLQAWRVATGEPIGSEVARGNDRLAWAGGNTLATWQGREAQLWTFANNSLMPLGKPKPLVLRADGLALAEPALVAISHEGKVQLWAGESDVPLEQPLPHMGVVWHMELSKHGKTLLTLSYDGLARVWDVAPAVRSKTLAKAPPLTAQDAGHGVFSPDGRYLLTALDSMTGAQIWDAASGQAHGSSLEYRERIGAMAFSADGKRAMIAGEKSVRTWNVEDGKLLTETALDPPLSVGRRARLAFSADGLNLLALGRGLEARDLATGKLRWKGFETNEFHPPIALSRDGRWLAACGYRGLKVPWLYDLESRGQRSLEIPQLQLAAVEALEFSPNGQLLAFAAHAHVRFWDVAAGRTWGPTLRHLDRISSLHWSPDGNRLLTGSWDQTAALWDVATGQSLTEFQHADHLRGAIFSPDSRIIATTDEEIVTRLWDADTGEPLGDPLGKPESSILVGEPALFSPTGRWLYVAGQPAQLWPVPRPVELDLKRLRDWAEALTGMRLEANNSIRVLSADEWRLRRARLERAGVKIGD